MHRPQRFASAPSTRRGTIPQIILTQEQRQYLKKEISKVTLARIRKSKGIPDPVAEYDDKGRRVDDAWRAKYNAERVEYNLRRKIAKGFTAMPAAGYFRCDECKRVHYRTQTRSQHHEDCSKWLPNPYKQAPQLSKV